MPLYQKNYRFLSSSLIVLLMACNNIQAANIDLIKFGETAGSSIKDITGPVATTSGRPNNTSGHVTSNRTGHKPRNTANRSIGNLSLSMGGLTFSTGPSAKLSLGLPEIKLTDRISRTGAPANLFPGNRIVSNASPRNPQQRPPNVRNSGPFSPKKTKTPDIPEPGPIALAAIGLLGAWIASRRRKTLLS